MFFGQGAANEVLQLAQRCGFRYVRTAARGAREATADPTCEMTLLHEIIVFSGNFDDFSNLGSAALAVGYNKNKNDYKHNKTMTKNDNKNDYKNDYDIACAT